MTSHLFTSDDVFLIVSGDDEYPSFASGTLHMWTDFDAAWDFVDDHQVVDVDVNSIPCLNSLGELLGEMTEAGCHAVCVDGRTIPIEAAVNELATTQTAY